MPSGGALPVAGLWAAPRIVSERTWLSGHPPAEPPQHSQIAHFGHEAGRVHPIELLGYDLDVSSARSGGTVQLTLYWRALRPIEVGYTVFVHLLDATGKMRGQKDSQPLSGTYPTHVWPPSMVVRDEYVVLVADDAPPGEYRLVIGLYDLATMKRLPAFDQGGVAYADARAVLDSTLKLR